MKNRKVLCAIVLTAISALVNPVVYAQSEVSMVSTNVEARAYIYEWRYKVIGDHLYKRLFNATTEEWVGDWILVQ